jgi:hypothetical protein
MPSTLSECYSDVWGSLSGLLSLIMTCCLRRSQILSWSLSLSCFSIFLSVRQEFKLVIQLPICEVRLSIPSMCGCHKDEWIRVVNTEFLLHLWCSSQGCTHSNSFYCAVREGFLLGVSNSIEMWNTSSKISKSVTELEIWIPKSSSQLKPLSFSTVSLFKSRTHVHRVPQNRRLINVTILPVSSWVSFCNCLV